MKADLQLFQLFYGLTNKYWIFDWLIIFFADYLAYFLALVLIFLIFWTYRNANQRWYYIFLTALSLLISRGLVTEVIRFFYHRPRPFIALNLEPLIEPSFSFSMPSGHATAFFAIAMIVFYLNPKYFGYFLVGAILMGLARIVAGVHWPLDIIVGAALGVLTVVIVKKLIPKIEK